MHKIANGSGDYCMYLEMACCFERKYSTGGYLFRVFKLPITLPHWGIFVRA